MINIKFYVVKVRLVWCPIIITLKNYTHDTIFGEQHQSIGEALFRKR